MIVFTLLTLGAMIAYLSQYSGFSTPLIAGLRAIAVVVGITATFLSPPLINRIGSIRSGIWFLSWQTIFLFPVSVILFLPLNTRLQGALLVGLVSLSRLGLWGFDLSEQYLVQQVVYLSLTPINNRKSMLRFVVNSQQRKPHFSLFSMYCNICRQLYFRNLRCSRFRY